MDTAHYPQNLIQTTRTKAPASTSSRQFRYHKVCSRVEKKDATEYLLESAEALGKHFPQQFELLELKPHMNRYQRLLDRIPEFWQQPPKHARTMLKDYTRALDGDFKEALKRMSGFAAAIDGELTYKDVDLLVSVSMINMLNHLAERSDKKGKKFYRDFTSIREGITQGGSAREDARSAPPKPASRKSRTSTSTTAEMSGTGSAESGAKHARRRPVVTAVQTKRMTIVSSSEESDA